ncbi:MAG: PQQ-like beta-propeller repeat protein [Treponema sp.]|nr:PQQ-like beta-propeller repeat protein [Treponema sp.]
MHKKLFSAFVIVFLLTHGALFAVTTLRTVDTKSQVPSWKLVAGGAVTAKPVVTDYGFAMLTDGRMIHAVGKSGLMLWQRGVKGNPSGYLTCESDFLLVVTNRDTLNLVNPSGITLWSVKTGFEIIDNPRMAKDGRIFVRGTEHVACYNLHGVRKWLLRTEKQRADIPLLLFDDGYLFVFLQATENSRSRAQLYSPFGKECDVTTFTAYVTAACETPYGALLSLKGGGAGLCAVHDGIAESMWVSPNVSVADATVVKAFSGGELAAFLFQNGKNLSASVISVKDGTVAPPISLGAFSLSKLLHCSVHPKGICVSDDNRALLFSQDGTVIWEALLPAGKNLAGVFYTADDTLIVYRKDWLMQAYVMQQAVTTKNHLHKAIHASYAERKTAGGTIGSMGFERISEQDMSFMQSSFARGDYSEQEKAWISSLQLELRNWVFDLHTGKQRSSDGSSYFIENPVYGEQILAASAKAGTADFAPLLADLLMTENRSEVITQIVHACGELAWDDEGFMLTAIEEALHKASPRDTVLLKAICDATYEICRYMGKPTLLKKGKNMLSFLLFPQFDSTTRDYARKTVKNILDLGL